MQNFLCDHGGMSYDYDHRTAAAPITLDDLSKPEQNFIKEIERASGASFEEVLSGMSGLIASFNGGTVGPGRMDAEFIRALAKYRKFRWLEFKGGKLFMVGF